MMVTFVSQCEKNALKKTRRVLDAFADRIGDNTWQTVITEEGLQAVKKLLRKTASKNTAVSCHWIRSRSRSELVWVVGKRDKFNDQGNVPVNSTFRNLLHNHIESDWHYLPLIKALTALASLLHDWGKASALFQLKLAPNNKQGFKGDPIRHEWISCLLLNALIQQYVDDKEEDNGWLKALARGEIQEELLKKVAAKNTDNPFRGLPPIAKLLAWLIVSHHRLPLPLGSPSELRKEWQGVSADTIDVTLNRISKEWGYENRYDEEEYQSRVKHCFSFPNGLISASTPWINQIKKWALRLHACEAQSKQALTDGSYRVVLHHSRLCLMLGDHFYSSQDADKKWQNSLGLYANTDRVTKAYKQKLDEHLVGVASNALRTAHLLPAFETEPPLAQDITSLKKPSPAAFRWQDKAVEKIKKWQLNAPKQKHGFFIVNMASTGCGKTYANAKVMRTLSADGNSLRYILALGLRTLTLQTGDEYRDRVGLDNSELAVLIGSRAVMELHQQITQDEKEESFENSGSLSKEKLLDEDIDYDCAIPEEGLATVLTCERDRKFLYAPVLTCTIDHMMAATETKRGGRYILPSLRLMSSDLVIDEIDDFTGNDLIAIGRLIHLAGMLGRKVMISSATIPPDLAEGYFKAYRDGWLLFCKTRNASTSIACAWIDEFSTQVSTNNEYELPKSILTYRRSHSDFISRRIKKLQHVSVKRKADISTCQFIFRENNVDKNAEAVANTKQKSYFNVIAQNALEKHMRHSCIDAATGLLVSFGVVRMANISPCLDLTKHLLNCEWPEDTEVRVMAYHSQQVLLMRSEQERHLDQVLKRKERAGSPPEAFSNIVVREHLTAIKKKSRGASNLLFILVATPVEEVGRDHDFDWAVIEPSSYRSIIQLAGRVRRHRAGEITDSNISLLQYNWKSVKNNRKENIRVFIYPGFESYFRLKSHNLSELLDESAIGEKLDAIPRIQKPPHINADYISNLTYANSLAELEHADTWRLLSNYKERGPSTLQGYLNETWFLTALPQHLCAFRQSEPSLKVYLVYDEPSDSYKFCEKDEKGYTINRENILGIRRGVLSDLAMSRLWLKRDFECSVEMLAQQQETSRRTVSLRYGELSFRHHVNTQYEYNDQLGMVRV